MLESVAETKVGHGIRVLCGVPHYYLPANAKEVRGQWKSANQVPLVRRQFVRRALASLESLARDSRISCVDVAVCGIAGRNLVELDIDFGGVDPLSIMRRTVRWMAESAADYDLFVLCEDDIVVPRRVVRNVLRFEEDSLENEVLHPCRLERVGSRWNDMDLAGFGQWTTQSRVWRGRELRVNLNPHSGVFVLPARKFYYCLSRCSLDEDRLLQVGGFRGGMMASTLARVLSPCMLYRCVGDKLFHSVVHQDRFAPVRSRRQRLWGLVKPAVPPLVVSGMKKALRRS